MGMNKLQGTPWHVERVHRSEGDARRSKRKCLYYLDGECKVNNRDCYKSAHCSKYKENPKYSSKNNRNKGIKNNVQRSIDLSKRSGIKPAFTIIQINNNDTVFYNIFRLIKENGHYHYRGFIENAKIKNGFQDKDVKGIYLRLNGTPKKCIYDKTSLEIIESGTYISVSFLLKGFEHEVAYDESLFSNICYGKDAIYGSISFKKKKDY